MLYMFFQGQEATLIRIDLPEVAALADGVHGKFLETIQLELSALHIRDINNVRSFLLLSIGNKRLTVGELNSNLLSPVVNLSYSLKKLNEAGYIFLERSPHDKRVVMVSSTIKGAELCERLQEMNDRHIRALAEDNFKIEDLITCRRVLSTLHRFWSRARSADPTDGITPMMQNSTITAFISSGNEEASAAPLS